jgi:hypothetical protein
VIREEKEGATQDSWHSSSRVTWLDSALSVSSGLTKTMETVILASAESPSLPATAPRRRSVQRWLLGVLGGLVVISAASLMLEGSTLRVDLTSGNSIDADPRALRLHVASHVVADAAQREELVPSWAADLADTRQVPENERLHLSLLHAACVSEQDACTAPPRGLPRRRGCGAAGRVGALVGG